MVVKLDKKDKAILKELEKDGRAMIKTISKNTGIQRDSVNYRINRLREQGVIRGFAPICNLDKMGYPVYSWINIELQKFDEETERRFKAFLKEHPNIPYASKVTGKYHYFFTIAAESIEHLDKTLREILATFPDMIKSYTSSLMVDEFKYDSFYKLIKE